MIKSIKNYLGEIATGIIIIGLVVYSFVGIGAISNIDSSFWISFGVKMAIMLLITSIWYPNSKLKAQLFDDGYINQRTQYGLLVDKVVQTNNQNNLNSFCEYATEENKIFKIKSKLRELNIDIETYNSFIKCPGKIFESNSLSKKQEKGLYKLITSNIKVKSISATSVLTGIKKVSLRYDVMSEEQKFDSLKITSKILISVASSIFMAFMIFTLYGFNWESVAQLFTWLALVAWNAYTSYSAGYQSISVHRTNYYKKLRTFLEEFISSEYYNKKTENNDNTSNLALNLTDIKQNTDSAINLSTNQ